MAAPRHRCLVVCAPGLEALVAGELAALGARPGRTVRGGVELSATTRQLYAANAWLRTATRVLVRLGSFEARTFAQLEQQAADLPWERHLAPGTTPAFRVTATASRLHHTDAVAERLARAAGGGADAGAHDQPPDQLVVARLDHDRVTISVDASGEPLYKRGWRQEVARAPLRETLAAAVLLASGWDPATPLVDPFCGSGTIPIEAALLASGRAPGADRAFAFQGWPTFEPGTWASVAATLRGPGGPADPTGPVAWGADRDEGAVAAARANADRAGVAHLVAFEAAAVSHAAPPPGRPPGWVLANPPYGARVGGGDLRDLYARLGQVLATRFAGWHAGLLVADARLAGHAGLGLAERLATTNGGIPVRLLAGPVPGG